MAHVRDETRCAGSVLEAGNQDFVAGDDRESRKRNAQCVVMKQRHAEQRQRKQDEVDRNPDNGGRLAGGRSEGGRGGQP